MSCAQATVYSELYAKSVSSTVKIAEGVPESNRFRQVADGKAHPLWLMGHLAMTMDLLIGTWMLGLKPSMPKE